VIDAGGFQQNRDYVTQLSYEHVDVMTGGLILTFTEIELPGGPGLDLQFQRKRSTKTVLTPH